MDTGKDAHKKNWTPRPMAAVFQLWCPFKTGVILSTVCGVIKADNGVVSPWHLDDFAHGKFMGPLKTTPKKRNGTPQHDFGFPPFKQIDSPPHGRGFALWFPFGSPWFPSKTGYRWEWHSPRPMAAVFRGRLTKTWATRRCRRCSAYSSARTEPTRRGPSGLRVGGVGG